MTRLKSIAILAAAEMMPAMSATPEASDPHPCFDTAPIRNSDPQPIGYFGTGITADGDTLVVGASRLDVAGICNAGVAYAFVLESGAWAEKQKIVASDPQSNALLGASAAMSGDLLALAAPLYTIQGVGAAGAVYVYRRDDELPETMQWQELDQIRLTAGSEAEADGLFGGPTLGSQQGVAMDGRLLIVGSPGVGGGGGKAYVFAYDPQAQEWSLEDTLQSPDPGDGHRFGQSVAISGARAIVGEDGDNAAYIFERDPISQQWGLSPAATLTGVGQSGWSVALAGTVAVVGAFSDNTVRVYRQISDRSILPIAIVIGSGAWGGTVGPPCLIADYDGAGLVEGQPPGPLESFGAGVIVRGSMTGAGAPFMGPDLDEALYAFQMLGPDGLRPLPPVFTTARQGFNAFGFRAVDVEGGAVVSDESWALALGAIYPVMAFDGVPPRPIPAPFPYTQLFGRSSAHAGSILLVGAPSADVGGEEDRGAAYAYTRDGDTWALETELVGPGTDMFDRVGTSVAVSAGGLALIGGTGVHANGFNFNGAAFAFRRTPEGRWVYEQQLVEPFGQIGNIWFGWATAMSADGTTAVITAVNADTQDGAAYVYDRVEDGWTFVEKIVPSNPVGSFAMYGNAVALSGDASFLAVSNSEDSEAGFSAGALYVYRRHVQTGLYAEVAKLLPPDPFVDDDFAASIDVDGDLLVVGQSVDEEDGGVGGIYVYAGVRGFDCNGNDVPDACDIASGTSDDADGDGVPDECGSADVNGDGVVDVDDLVAVILAWGPCRRPPAGCPADVDGDGEVAVGDLVAVVLAWS